MTGDLCLKTNFPFKEIKRVKGRGKVGGGGLEERDKGKERRGNR